jgi:hypothetical protein
VPADRRLGTHAVASRQRVDDRLMFLEHLLATPGTALERHHTQQHVPGSQHLVQAGQHGVARGNDERFVKLPIEVDELAGAAVGHDGPLAVQHRRHLRDRWMAVVQAGRGSPPLDEPAGLHHFGDLSSRDRCHEGAAVRQQLHQILGGEHQQRLSHRGARNPELGGDRLLVDERAGNVGVGEHRGPQILVRPVPTRVTVQPHTTCIHQGQHDDHRVRDPARFRPYRCRHALMTACARSRNISVSSRT